MKISNHRRISILCFHLLLTSAFSVPPPPPSSDYGGDYDYDYTPPPPPAPCNPSDSNTLLRIKQALNNSIIFSSWLPNTDCCLNRWEFVGCDATTGHVIGLSINGNGWGHDDLPRILPSAIGDLTYLRNLRFHNNALGPIPRSLAKLQHLEFLYLSHNNFTGPIPNYLSQMQNLSWLELSGNSLTGPIPSSLSNAPSIYLLKLDNNRLVGRIPSGLGHMSTLRDNVYNIDLSYNDLSGPIPSSFGGVKFRTLFLSGNRLTGDASFVFGKDKNVWLIDFSGNKLSFNMSNIEIPPQLAWLGLSQNRIYGGLPTALANLDSLSYFNVSYNHLRGPIPQGGKLQRFGETAYFHNEGLCGSPLPSC